MPLEVENGLFFGWGKPMVSWYPCVMLVNLSESLFPMVKLSGGQPQPLDKLFDGQISTRRLIINGDVFDSIDFRRLKKTHWKVLSLIRHLSDKIEVIWTSGNHDGPAEIISHLLGVQVLNEYMFFSGQRRMLVIHGDLFDDFIDHHPVLTWFGDLIYNALQKVDRQHYIARLAKSRSKVFLHCMDKVRVKSMAYAQKKGCNVVICGHTHLAAAERGGPVEYYNSGCWTELPTTYLTITAGEVTLHRDAAGADVMEDLPTAVVA